MVWKDNWAISKRQGFYRSAGGSHEPERRQSDLRDRVASSINAQPQSINCFGNPSDATTDPDDRDNLLMIKHQFVLSFNNSKGGANWVAWHLQSSGIGNVDRGDFHVDTSLSEGFKRVTKQD